jgi:hypothetical protein
MVTATPTARALLAELRHRQAFLRVVGDRLEAYGPKNFVDAELQELVGDYKQEIIALLKTEDEALSWRVAAMRPQAPARGPIPFLGARPQAQRDDASGLCRSCGESLPEGRKYRCPLCVRAAEIVLLEMREGS